MSVLASLARAYDRLPDAAPFGFSLTRISALVSLHPDGSVASVTDLRDGSGRKRQAPTMPVPQAVKRTVAVAPNFLWDKTAYALGLTAGEGKRTAQEHAAFRARHAEWLDGAEDEGLVAFLRFLDGWEPGVALPGWSDDLLDGNVAFTLEADRLSRSFLHDRPAAREAWRRVAGAGARGAQACLVSGEAGPVARLHPSIKGVWGSQSSGASLVSFNLDAFSSYGHEQGDNAPVSEAAAFAYSTALNRFLQTSSGHRVQIGDASTVFWADASDMDAAALAELMAGALFDAAPVPTTEDDAAEAKKVADKLDAIRQGRPLAEVEPRLTKGVRFHVLGLAPNAARLSVRFAWEGDFGELTGNYQQHLKDLSIKPGPREAAPALWKYLAEVAVQSKRENVPPGLAGDWMRAILTGSRYPETLLATTLMRVRADQSVNALRAAILKAMLVRNYQGEETLVALDENSDSTAYQLGRLFAVMEAAQRAALGQVNAGIGDRYYAAASATPARVFAALLRGLRVHVSDARKRGRGGWIEPRVGQIMARLPADLPTSLRIVDQGRFAVGYYHEKSYRAPKVENDAVPVVEEAPEAPATEPAKATATMGTPDMFQGADDA